MSPVLPGIFSVEPIDQSAVIWTGPDHLEPDPESPSNGLIRPYPGGFPASATAVVQGKDRPKLAALQEKLTAPLRAAKSRKTEESGPWRSCSTPTSCSTCF